MELSKRLLAVARLVTEGAFVADIGTDHGYIPIYLVKNKIISGAIAMDINEGPLARAREHILKEGLEQRIETRLSDGFSKLEPGEADTVIAAGMGGGLIIRIMKACPGVTEITGEFILQPQSEIGKVRKYLNDSGFAVAAEDMAEEEGKFYPMMKVVHGIEPKLTEEELRYGRILLREKNPVLYNFLCREKNIKLGVMENLMKQHSERAKERCLEIAEDLKWIRAALSVY